MKQVIENSKKRVRVIKNGEVVLSACWNMVTTIYHTYCNYTEKTECFLSIGEKCYSGTDRHTVINRSWECYEGQSTISGSFYDIICQVKYSIINDIKKENGWQKFTSKRMEVITPLLENNETLKLLKLVYDEIEHNSSSFIEINID